MKFSLVFVLFDLMYSEKEMELAFNIIISCFFLFVQYLDSVSLAGIDSSFVGYDIHEENL